MKPQTGDFVEGLRNLTTKKLFICLEASASPGSVRVINPSGDILVVREELFDLEPVEVPLGELDGNFTGEQILSWRAYQEDEAERRRVEAERIAREAARPPSDANRHSGGGSSRAPVTRTPQSRSSRRTGMTPVKVVPGRVVAQWSGERLVFYRHRIDPLRPADQFQVEIHGVGTFRITKADFQRVFNNVVMSSQYRSQGIYTYDDVPEEAQAYIRR